MISSRSSKGKGKQRAVVRDEGSGGADGIVLPLDVVGDGDYDVTYSIPILVGSSSQNLSLQVDTGSSDLWIASTSCSSTSCGQTSGRLYDPKDATQTGQSFSINYLQGNVSGPIVWDQIDLGGYSISNQALAAADTVQSESLSYNFNGILGLALPLNSLISQTIPPVTSNNPDGAAFASNLFSLTPSSSAPSARFISLSLSRQGSDAIPALLGIGKHPAEVVTDPSKILYSTLVSESSGTLFWKLSVRAITVYVDGVAKPVTLGQSSSGEAFPTAVLDSGVPLILTTSAIANGIYGAIGISPAQDGQYYVPCSTPLNLTITLDDRPETPIHPLDLTAQPPEGASDQDCIGLIQSNDAQLATPNSLIGDMILGVPFMRNTYTVMAYEIPDSNGSFVGNATGGGTAPKSAAIGVGITPRLGLLNLTNPTTAMEEFKRVRVMNQPLSPNSSEGTQAVGKKMSVGIDVLIGLLSFFGLCFMLFALRWFVSRRPWGKGNRGVRRGEFGGDQKGLGAYELARRGSQSSDSQPSEDALRQMRFEAYVRKNRDSFEHSTSTARTRVGDEVDGGGGELGYKAGLQSVELPPLPGADSWDPATGLDWGGGTLVGGARTKTPIDPDERDEDLPPEWPGHQRTGSQLSVMRPVAHVRVLSDSVPLLPPTVDEESPPDDEPGEFGLVGAGGMAGVGTAARGGKFGPGLRHGSVGTVEGVGGVVQPTSTGALGPSQGQGGGS